MTAPAGSAGPVTVTVTTAGGSATTTYTYVAAPTIISISPGSGPLTAGNKVNITGTNLSNASVTFGINASTIIANTGTTINMTAPAASSPGQVNVTVTTPGGSTTTTYTYVAAPTITSISPISGPTAGGNWVNITGTNLSNALVTFGTNATTIANNTVTTINLTAPAAGSAGQVTVTVTTAGGSATITYWYNNPVIRIFNSTPTGGNWTVPANISTVEYLVVAGGGGGGYYGGGGGGGGFRNGTVSVTPGSNLTVTVGTGGIAGANSGTGQGGNGSNSVFASITANGGGGGGSYYTSTANHNGINGGSGGGAVGTGSIVGTGISGQGNNGGTGITYQSTRYNGGGGGGASGGGGNLLLKRLEEQVVQVVTLR